MSARFQVHIDSLTKTYEDRTVLSVDSLALDAGVLYALIGSNGSGKSTLLRALAGTAGISSGTISVSGERTKDQVTVGYMPQKPYVFGFSVFRNVSLAIPAGTCSAQEARERVQHALEEVGMERMQQAHGNTLSGGEAQRVALARILVRDLDVVLLDEPTASMDVEGTLQVERALASYRARTQCLTVVATHAPAQAKRIAERAVMLDKGRVVEEGPIDDVLLRPSTDAGRSFLSYWQL